MAPSQDDQRWQLFDQRITNLEKVLLIGNGQEPLVKQVSDNTILTRQSLKESQDNGLLIRNLNDCINKKFNRLTWTIISALTIVLFGIICVMTYSAYINGVFALPQNPPIVSPGKSSP